MADIVPLEVVPTGLARALDRLLLHVVDRVADQRADRLAVLALFLRDRLIMLFIAALCVFVRCLG